MDKEMGMREIDTQRQTDWKRAGTKVEKIC
jgi:hypothetical protein